MNKRFVLTKQHNVKAIKHGKKKPCAKAQSANKALKKRLIIANHKLKAFFTYRVSRYFAFISKPDMLMLSGSNLVVAAMLSLHASIIIGFLLLLAGATLFGFGYLLKQYQLFRAKRRKALAGKVNLFASKKTMIVPGHNKAPEHKHGKAQYLSNKQCSLS